MDWISYFSGRLTVDPDVPLEEFSTYLKKNSSILPLYEIINAYADKTQHLIILMNDLSPHMFASEMFYAKLPHKTISELIKAFEYNLVVLTIIVRNALHRMDITYLDIIFNIFPIKDLIDEEDDGDKERDHIKDTLYDSLEVNHDVLRYILTKLRDAGVDLNSYCKSIVGIAISSRSGVDVLRILLSEFNISPNLRRPSSTKSPLSVCINEDDADSLHELYIAGCNFVLDTTKKSLFQYCFSKEAVNVTAVLFNLGLFNDQDFEVLNGSHCDFLLEVNLKVDDEDTFIHRCIRVNQKPSLIIRGIVRSDCERGYCPPADRDSMVSESLKKYIVDYYDRMKK